MRPISKNSRQISNFILMNDISNIIHQKSSHNEISKSNTKFPDSTINEFNDNILLQNKAFSTIQTFKKSSLRNYNNKKKIGKKVNFSLTKNSLSDIESTKFNLSQIKSLKKPKNKNYFNNSKNNTMNNSKNNTMNNTLNSVSNNCFNNKKYLKTCSNKFLSKNKSKQFLSLDKNHYLSSDKNLNKHKKYINFIEYYDNKKNNEGHCKLAFDLKKINDINEKFKQKIRQIKFRYNSKDKMMQKKFNSYKKKLTALNLKKLMDENIREFLQPKKNKSNNKNNEVSYIKNYENDTLNILNLVKERRAKEKQFIENAEDIMFKNILLIYDVNRINRRLNYQKFIYEHPI